MPKQKTHKGLAKRVKITATGKVSHNKAFKSHLMSSKTSKRRRHLRKKSLAPKGRLKALRQLLGS